MPSHYQYQYSRWTRAAILLFVLMTCVRVWVGPMPLVAEARAQIPDSGKQRLQLLQETQRTNQILNEIKQLLKGHTFKVRVEGADNSLGVSPRPRRKP